MTDDELRAAATHAGIATHWHDVFGQEHAAAVPTLRVVLDAVGPPAAPGGLPPLVTADAGASILLPVPPGRYRLRLEDGRHFDGTADPAANGCAARAVLEPGYHTLEIGGRETVVAVAPLRGCTVPDRVVGGRALAIAVQLYALRRPGDAGIGDFASLADFARAAAARGVHAVAISPLHAQFSADPDRFSPYAPSSRVALNVLHIPVDAETSPGWRAEADRLEALPMVAWPDAGRARLERLRSMFAQARADAEIMEAFYAFRQARGETLERHARFEALHAYFYRHSNKHWHWRSWPPAYRDPARPEVAAFARDHARQVDFHAFVQFLADRGLAAAQRAARDAGMPIGLIADLAVGADSGGSHAWSRQREMLGGLSIGAPPDLFHADGQNWGLAAFSPRGLRAHGFAAFLDMLRTALAHAGGVRIDHAMGLRRLWVVPDGAGARDGTYLAFPEQDLLRLLALESHRHQAIVLGEDLGTVPEGFQDTLASRGIYGMRVLWFERDQAQHFTPPATWSVMAAGMTSTHDLPTVAGWWQGRDLDWRRRLGHTADNDEADRATERDRLWRAMVESGAAQGPAPPCTDSAPVAAAACRHVAGSACALAILPIEDVLGLPEQPNLPNTTDEHPNWRRRLERPADELLADFCITRE